MDQLLESLDALFGDVGVRRDDRGRLRELAGILAAHQPRLLYLSASAGATVIAAELELNSSLDLQLAAELAAQARHDLREGPWVCEPKWLQGHEHQAFALLLPLPGEPVLGGLLASPARSDDWQRMLPVLEVCGRLVWRITRVDAVAVESKTRIRHLIAEHDTLKAAHSEATVKAIEEQEHRLREEQERLAIERICAANEAANAAKSQFLANMSHEIRTPLTAIIGFTELLRQGADGGREAERQDYLRMIHRGATHLLELLNDILDLSKIEAGRMHMERIRCSPQQIVACVFSIMRVRAQEKGLRFVCAWPNGVPDSILTDPLRLKQLLLNLMGNALKFTSRGEVRLVCRLLTDRDEPQMAFDVIDTGIGIAPDKLQGIFDAFVQADNSVTREFGGTGLGLAISRRIAQALGGDISVASEPGQGSTFTATIDAGSLEGVRVLPSQGGEALAAEPEPLTACTIDLHHTRVLLVEDGAVNRKLIGLLLGRLGAQVTTAENGKIGLDLGTSRAFDLILMDMQMPVMDGYTAARRLRQAGVATPIIALTAHAMNGDEDKCLRAGCTAYLAKPLTSERLQQVVAGVLASAKSPVTSPQPSAGAAADGPKRMASVSPLVSTLPLDEPEFREVIEEFKVFLKDELAALREALAAGDMPSVARLAHTIRGTAGTAGFPAFTEPSQELERLAKEGRRKEIPVLMAMLEGLAQRVEAILSKG